MMQKNAKIMADSISFIKKNKNKLAADLADLKKYPSDEYPVSIFMAGSPGAGKTEFSKNFLKILEQRGEKNSIRIDPDEMRSLIPGYTGNNSHLVQGAVSILVSTVHDFVLKHKQNFLMDGTFANYGKAVENIKRSLSRGRRTFVFYVYQKPQIAWKFTQQREVVEGRNILKNVFIERFLAAKETVNKISDEFGEAIEVHFVRKNFTDGTTEKMIRISSGHKIDDFIEENYTAEELRKIL